MPDSLTPAPKSGFVCDCEGWQRSACAGQAFYREHEGKRYCVLHLPHDQKYLDFQRVFREKLEKKEFIFRGVWFPAEAFVPSTDFETVADFSGATFSGPADFACSTFSALADFSLVTFIGNVNFSLANFSSDADFRAATFGGSVNFNFATFKDHVRFEGDEKHIPFIDTSSLDLRFAKIEKPDCISFRTLNLRPHWFVTVDPRKFDFTNVDWDWRNVNEEIQSLRDKDYSSPHRLLAIACGHLAVNAEGVNRYEEGSKFRYFAMDARRREKWRGFAFWKLSWWYWLASGYGERAFQAFGVLLGVLLLSALLYNQVGFARWEPKIASESDMITAKRDEIGAPLPLLRALGYSAGVITLQKPEPQPATIPAQTVVFLETIFGPVQAALLALAIRRKFMR